MMIGLANGSVEVLVGEPHGRLPLNIARILVTMDFPIIHTNGAYSLLFGANWLRRVQATANCITGEYSMETPSRRVFIRNTPLGCEVLCTEWKMDQENRPPVEDVGDDVSTDSETNSNNDSEVSPISSSSSNHSVPDEVEGCDVLEEIVDVAADANPQEERNRDGWRTAEFIEFFNSRTQNTSSMATSAEMTPEYLRNLQYGAELMAEEKEQIANLLYKYRECFATSLTDMGRTKLLEHQIQVAEGTRPVYRPGLKRFSQPELAFIKE